MIKYLACIGIILLIVLAGPFVISHSPNDTNPELQFHPPEPAHPLGTDLLGRDVLSRYMFGGRQTLSTAITATMIALSLGVSMGIVSGIVPWAHHVLVPVFTAVLAIPGLVQALVVLTIAGRGVLPLALAIGISQVASIALVTRSAVLAMLMQPYVEAARALGADRTHILRYHILPNISGILVTYSGVVFAYALLNGAALTFLGVGYVPGTPEWGIMLAESRSVIRLAPWIGIAPGLSITLLVWAVNGLADHVSSTRHKLH